jgi:hypothetical protein
VLEAVPARCEDEALASDAGCALCVLLCVAERRDLQYAASADNEAAACSHARALLPRLPAQQRVVLAWAAKARPLLPAQVERAVGYVVTILGVSVPPSELAAEQTGDAAAAAEAVGAALGSELLALACEGPPHAHIRAQRTSLVAQLAQQSAAHPLLLSACVGAGLVAAWYFTRSGSAMSSQVWHCERRCKC